MGYSQENAGCPLTNGYHVFMVLFIATVRGVAAKGRAAYRSLLFITDD